MVAILMVLCLLLLKQRNTFSYKTGMFINIVIVGHKRTLFQQVKCVIRAEITQRRYYNKIPCHQKTWR